MDAASEAAHAEASARPLTAAEELAEYAASLRYHAIPEDVRALAGACLIDTVAAAIAGAAAPASQIVLSLATGAGPCRIIGASGPPVRAESASLANGVAAHALELDSLRQPSAGVHPGAVLVPAALAAAQERGRGGEALLAGIVAGCEVLCRVGRATRHSAEARGFHAPGLTGPFGAAIAAGHIFGLDRVAMTNALGIAGSLAGGLLAFAPPRPASSPHASPSTASPDRARCSKAASDSSRPSAPHPIPPHSPPGSAPRGRPGRSASSAIPAISARIRRCARSSFCAASTRSTPPTSAK
jgi:2-methylcitrate dehydratase PrpD